MRPGPVEGGAAAPAKRDARGGRPAGSPLLLRSPRGVLGDAICRRPMSFVSDSRLPRGNFGIGSRVREGNRECHYHAPTSKDRASRTVLSEVIGLRIRLLSRGNVRRKVTGLFGWQTMWCLGAVVCDPLAALALRVAHSGASTLCILNGSGCRHILPVSVAFF